MGLSIMTFCSRSQRRLVLFRRSCFFKISPMPGLSFGTRLIGLLPSAPGALGSDGLMASGDPPVQALYGNCRWHVRISPSYFVHFCNRSLTHFDLGGGVAKKRIAAQE
jgi:hypothetical protein